MLEDVHFAHGTGAMLQQPRIDAALVEVVTVVENAGTYHIEWKTGTENAKGLMHLPAWQHPDQVGDLVRFDANRAAIVLDLFVIGLDAFRRDLGDNALRHRAQLALDWNNYGDG